jgi:hypothetical protein
MWSGIGVTPQIESLEIGETDPGDLVCCPQETISSITFFFFLKMIVNEAKKMLVSSLYINYVVCSELKRKSFRKPRD